MSTTSRDELSLRVRDLWRAVNELTVIAFEDRPHDLDLIAVDDFSDRVSDLQGQVHYLQQACAATGDPVRSLQSAGELLEQAARTYWSDLRCGRPLSEITVTGRRRSDELAAWAQSLTACISQCEQPLWDVGAAWRLSWPELLRSDAAAQRPEQIDLQSSYDSNTTVEVPR